MVRGQFSGGQFSSGAVVRGAGAIFLGGNYLGGGATVRIPTASVGLFLSLKLLNQFSFVFIFLLRRINSNLFEIIHLNLK